MAEFRIFQDIRLIIGRADDIGSENAAEISFCRSGVCEYCVNDEYYYLTAGNCVIACHDGSSVCHTVCSPDYSGVTLLIDSRCNSKAFDEFLNMPDILRNMQSCGQCLFSADDNIKRLFFEIYDTSDASMLRIRVLELLMLIGGKRNSAGEKIGRIRKIGSFICGNLCDHYTIAQLSLLFGIDRTTLKLLFRQTFGCPVYTYAKNRKMFRAAELLGNTEMKIIDVAEEVGYCNASKFSSAFRDVMGTSPRNFQTERKRKRKYKKRDIAAELAY